MVDRSDLPEGPVSTARDTGWCWVVLLASHVAFLLWEGLCKGLGVLLPTLTEQFGTETWPVGWTIGMMLAARGVSGKSPESLCLYQAAMLCNKGFKGLSWIGRFGLQKRPSL